jgi:mRNA interferase MazF
MKRGELYRVAQPPAPDPKPYRVFVIVSRQVVIDSRMSTVVCAPVHSSYDGLSTQVPIGSDEGLKHDSSIHCDELVTLPKAVLTNYMGSLSLQRIRDLNRALRIALDLQDEAPWTTSLS